MNKKLIAVVLAALPVVAMADVTLYGNLKADVESDSLTGNPTTNKVQDDLSLIGFKGTEDLGNGLKTVWQIENRVMIDGTSQKGFATRQTFVGLDGGNLGVIRLGYVNNFLNDQYSVDQWQYNDTYEGANPGGANGLAVFANSGDRLKNAVRYDSATFFGFSAGAELGFGENNQNQAALVPGQTSNPSNVVGAALNYTYGGVAAHYAYQQEKNAQNGDAVSLNEGKNASKSLYEVDYTGGNLFLSGAYQTAVGYSWTDDFAGDSVDDSGLGGNAISAQLKTQQVAVSAAYTIGAITPQISFAKGFNAKIGNSSISDSGYKQWVAGVNYALSKRTTAGISYGQLKFDPNTDFAQYNVPGTTSDVTLKTVALSLATSF